MSRRGSEMPKGMVEKAVLEVIGADLFGVLYDIARRDLDHGTHWVWWAGSTCYTPLGLERIAQRLRAGGHRVMADRLDDHRRMMFGDELSADLLRGHVLVGGNGRDEGRPASVESQQSKIS